MWQNASITTKHRAEIGRPATRFSLSRGCLKKINGVPLRVKSRRCDGTRGVNDKNTRVSKKESNVD